MKKRGKRVLLVSLGAEFGVVLGAIAFAFSVVKEDAPYEFMRGARQDGFWAPIISGTPLANRSYVLERECDDVLGEARNELSSANGWYEVSHDGVTMFSTDAGAIWIEPMAGDPSRTSVTSIRDATKAEEILGTVYESIPGRHKRLRL